LACCTLRVVISAVRATAEMLPAICPLLVAASVTLRLFRLTGEDSEPFTHLPRWGRFDGGIECQQVGDGTHDRSHEEHRDDQADPKVCSMLQKGSPKRARARRIVLQLPGLVMGLIFVLSWLGQSRISGSGPCRTDSPPRKAYPCAATS